MTYTEKVEFLNEIRESFDNLDGIRYDKIIDHLIDTYGQMARTEKLDTFNYAEVE